jgi:hypothetical protein
MMHFQVKEEHLESNGARRMIRNVTEGGNIGKLSEMPALTLKVHEEKMDSDAKKIDKMLAPIIKPVAVASSKQRAEVRNLSRTAISNTSE